jgi:flagellar assembly factor FliW
MRRSAPMTDANQPSVAPAEEHLARSLEGKELFFPEGLLGFPDDRRYRLTRFAAGSDGESPFLILKSLDHDLSFPLIHPDFVTPNYCVPVAPETMASLNATGEADLVPFLIVTVRERVEDITVNLQGPLIINSVSLIGKQLVLEEYPLRYALVQSNLP